MQTKSDAQLLRDYAAHGSEPAFAGIVARHTDLVYSAAWRQTGSPELAREIAQAVFTDLARKAHALAGGLTPDASLTGWLYRSTRYEVLTVLRDERRRQAHQRLVMEHFNPAADPAPDWQQIAPVLDEAMAELGDADRESLLLRYFQNQDFHAVGRALGVSDDAAQKRVSRAVERLREFLAQRGVTLGAQGLVVVLAANAVQAAPIGLVLTISTAAALGGTTIAATATATALKTIAMTITQKVLITTVLAAAVGTGIYKAREASTLRSQVETLQQQLTQERDDAARQIAVAPAASPVESGPVRTDNTELLKLRGEVTRLRMDAANLPKAKAEQAIGDPLALAQGALDKQKQNASLLKSYFDLNPGAKIPEAEVGSAQAMYTAAIGYAGFNRTPPETQEDYRRAAAEARGWAESLFARRLVTAAKKYQEANNKEFPTAVSELQPYFAKSGDDSMLKTILERYEIQPLSKFPNPPSKLSTDWIITQKALVDEEFDHRIFAGPEGFVQDTRNRKLRP